MRANPLLLAVVLFATGCASVSRAPGRGGTIGFAARVSSREPTREPRHITPPHAMASSSDDDGRIRRHRVFREDTSSQEDSTVGVAAGGAVASLPLNLDAWESLLTNAGLAARDERPIPGGPLTPTQAAKILATLLGKDVTLGQFPARLAVGFMLREVLGSGEVSRAELVQRVERFNHLAVLRPDGCLAWVRSGRTQQRVAPVEWRDGSFRAHGFELGRFYDGRTGVFRSLDDELREVNGFAIADVHDDADVISRTLDGAEEAFVGLALAVGQFFSTSPSDNLEALRQMPAAVAALLASSPEYLERFQYMTRGEQIQVVSKLVTNLIATWGTASAATRTLQGATLATAEVPVLSLSAQGALAMESVAVPVGRAAAVLSGGPGAAIILQRAATAAKQGGPSKGPGQWGPAKESMKPRARRYQEQITGHTADDAYWVGGMSTKDGGVKFDGFEDGLLLEAKGPGYAKFFEGLDPKVWFRHSGAKRLVEQADRQLRAANGTRIRWHVAEENAADAIRKLLRGSKLKDIEVVHTPAL
ncbi:Tox-REase-5 domain-containing protein [Myxococcus qinghaiensis]|uniref:Tox-REase-5 domain-containing protein n=1 Tax=Myxococcus qinghaiensis TaxID=2906758 RepID=UPI0020A732D8|nr:Tox-REase-5 domain-containing protein [Myxococcus qinghaiensis]MCP3170210.1 restriction endonuclease fold toxin 5 domain-containing protein [Myxococcus qinghaiensis]